MARIPKYIREETKDAWETKRSSERCTMIKQKVADFKAKHPEEYKKLSKLDNKVEVLEAERKVIKDQLFEFKKQDGLMDLNYRAYSGCSYEDRDPEINEFDIHTRAISTEIMTTTEFDSSKYLN